MDCQKVELKETNRFSSFFLDYIAPREELRPFYNHFPSAGNFNKQIEQKSSFSQEKRNILIKALEKQYSNISITEDVQRNIHLLQDNKTFTITTGHQLNIFTGPLYFIFKIVTVINACTKLKKEFPRYNFVPVFWMASEDHDFEEINNTRVNGKKYVWETEQKGAVGKFNTSSIKSLLHEIPGVPEFFHKAYKLSTLSEAARFYVNHLFGKYGLVVLDGDDPILKNQFREVIKNDIFNHTAKKLVDAASEKLEKLNYKPQVFPRDINFFYLGEGFRERIEKYGEEFKVLGTDLSFDKGQLTTEIDEHPEKFSPNVVLRPLYEEMVLPNLAYIGGPAEMVYWLQLKEVFVHYGEPFPILLPRNFGMLIPKNIQKKIDKTGLSPFDLFRKKEDLFKDVISKNSAHEIHLNGQMEKLQELFNMIKKQAEQIDPTLGPHVEAQQVKTNKRLEVIEKKFIRAEKRNQSDKLKQVEAILDYLFPNGALQERSDNFLTFYNGHPQFIEDLLSCFDPFDFRFHIINYGR